MTTATTMAVAADQLTCLLSAAAPSLMLCRHLVYVKQVCGGATSAVAVAAVMVIAATMAVLVEAQTPPLLLADLVVQELWRLQCQHHRRLLVGNLTRQQWRL